jgi:P-type Ca2+ transporter type 2C
VRESAGRFGHNRLTPLRREPAWRKLLAKFDEPIILILLAALLLKLVVDLFEAAAWAGFAGFLATAGVFSLRLLPRVAGWVPAALFAVAAVLVVLGVGLGKPSYEGLAVMIAVALATGVAFASEYRSDREFESLNASKDSIRVKVQRGGAIQYLQLEDLVVGDWIALEAGDEIPADGRPIAANELAVDQSLMTGESEPVPKSTAAESEENDDPSAEWCLHRGTQVVGGAGAMLVTNVGDDTMLGQIARRLGGTDIEPGERTDRVQRKLALDRESTPLQEKLERLAKLISKVGYFAAVAIFVALVARGLHTGELRWPVTDERPADVLLANFRALLSYFVYMVIVIVVAVPEGLPMSVTVSLALAMRKMTRANSLVRQLVACETIGSATVICTDKTGTLTRNKMTVVCIDGDSPILRLNAAVNATARLTEKDGQPVVVGNTTEGALLLWLNLQGDTGAERLRAELPILHQSTFSSKSKRMTTVVERDGRIVVLVKGAPEQLLAECDTAARSKAEIEIQLSDASAMAMRTLGFAHRILPMGTLPDRVDEMRASGELERGLHFDGFVGIRDPLRDDARDAIRECRRAGIAIIMVTGDNAETARAVARDADLLAPPRDLVLTSAEMMRMSDDELKARIPRLVVVARAQPLDKYRLVQLLQQEGHVVAMTGDGTNDAPSLRKADVGLAMGLSGTEVAKEASKIVLLDDSFATITKAVRWGRALYENIQKFIVFQLTINVSALVIALLGPFLGFRPPFTVLQLLWINVIMDTFAAIALCSESPRRRLMDLPPKRRDENILTRSMLTTIGVTASFFIVTMIALLLGMQYDDWFAGHGEVSGEFFPLTVRQATIFFTVYVLFQFWNQINCRSLDPHTSGLAGLHRNKTFLIVSGLTLLGQVLIVSFGGRIFQVEPLKLVDWLVILAATSSVVIFTELIRRIRRMGTP